MSPVLLLFASICLLSLSGLYADSEERRDTLSPLLQSFRGGVSAADRFEETSAQWFIQEVYDGGDDNLRKCAGNYIQSAYQTGFCYADATVEGQYFKVKYAQGGKRYMQQWYTDNLCHAPVANKNESNAVSGPKGCTFAEVGTDTDGLNIRTYFRASTNNLFKKGGALFSYFAKAASCKRGLNAVEYVYRSSPCVATPHGSTLYSCKKVKGVAKVVETHFTNSAQCKKNGNVTTATYNANACTPATGQSYGYLQISCPTGTMMETIQDYFTNLFF